ncbi:hypothetical protein J1N35_035115 [Gossypium stocksii]|uniref:RNase H type-1 domain-containing protein n=1 Tax=Gossypium stocksii TaxID=47602 RepID=A0A9D3UTU4_9ROSI|nr:hypothetical protein J1N35_035115 [Gossypium stocksii]
MVLDNGEWNFDLFKLWLPDDVVNRIISIPPPSESAGPDTIFWSKTTCGVFSVKSAYSLLKEESWNPKDEIWNVVWKAPGPQKGVPMSANDIISTSFSWAYHFSSNYNAVVENRPIRPTDPQDSGMCFYLNTDGAVQTASGLFVAGGVIRDGKGKWIMGYNKHLGKCTVAVAELWGIWDGLRLLQKQGYDKVII